MKNNNKWIWLCAIGVIVVSFGLLYLVRHFDYSPHIDRALSKHNFARAHKLLNKQYKQAQYLEEEEKYIRLEQTYEVSAQKIFQREIEFLLCEDNEMAFDKIASLAREYQLIASPYVGVTDLDHIFISNDYYNKSASRFNAIIDNIVDYGITANNHILIEKAIPLYKPILKKTTHESHFFGNDEYSYSYSYEARENAAALYAKYLESKGILTSNKIIETYKAKPIATPSSSPIGDGMGILLLLICFYAICCIAHKDILYTNHV